MNVLLPWKSDKIMSCRYTVNNPSVTTRYYACAIMSGDGFICFAFDIKNKSMSLKGKHRTREAAMSFIDEALVKVGWRLINEGDKLAVLL